MVDFHSGPKVPFPWGSNNNNLINNLIFILRKIHVNMIKCVLDIGQFHSPQMKPCKSPDYFIKVSFHFVVDMRQGESNIFQISTWKTFLLLKYIYYEKSDRFG